MGASASCPVNTTLSVDACYGPCPAGMATNALYRKLCASTAECPAGSAVDVTGLACEKTVTGSGIVAKPEEGGCPVDYTEWSANNCYKNCPTTFLENGFDCRKKTILRESFVPQCSMLTSFNNGMCQFDYYGLVIVIVTVFVARYYFTRRLHKPDFPHPQPVVAS